MVEASENPELVHHQRRQTVEAYRRKRQQAIAEGRMAEKPRAAGPSQLVVAPASSDADTHAVELQSAEAKAAPADPEAAWRHTRLAITAGLVLLLLVVWIWQKRSGR